MDEQEVRELFFERLANLSAEEYHPRHPDYAYLDPPTIRPRRVGRIG